MATIDMVSDRMYGVIMTNATNVTQALASLREFVADPSVRTGAPLAEWTEREARLQRAINAACEQARHEGREALMRVIVDECGGGPSLAHADGGVLTILRNQRDAGRVEARDLALDAVEAVFGEGVSRQAITEAIAAAIGD